MISKTTVYKNSNHVDLSNYRSPDIFQQIRNKTILHMHSQLLKHQRENVKQFK